MTVSMYIDQRNNYIVKRRGKFRLIYENKSDAILAFTLVRQKINKLPKEEKEERTNKCR